MYVIEKRISQKSDTANSYTHYILIKGFSGMFVSWQKNFHGSTMVLKALFVIMIESDLLRADFVAEIGPTFLSFGSAQAVRSV